MTEAANDSTDRVQGFERGTDRFERQIHMKAPRSKVWQAITDAKQFGQWFGCELRGDFAAGQPIQGKINDPPGYEHLPMELQVQQIEPETRFSFRWHPYAVEGEVDYAKEPTTLIEFVLEDRDGGTLLTISESGFDAIPEHRRAEAYRNNGKGWAIQAQRIARHVGG